MKKILILMCMVAVGLTSCVDPVNQSDSENNVSLKYPRVDADADFQWVTVETQGEWIAEIIYTIGEGEEGGEGYGEEDGEEPEKWATLSHVSGRGNKLIKLSYDLNDLGEARSLDVVVTFERGAPKGVSLTQEAAGGEIVVENLVQLSTANIAHNATADVDVTITSEMNWEVTLLYDNVASNWANISKTEGAGNDVIQLTPTANSSQSQRAVIISVEFSDGDTKTATLIQGGISEPRENSIQLSTNNIAYNSTSDVDVTITGEANWEVTLQYGSGASNWANISKTEGAGNDVIQLTPTANSSQSQRAVIISVEFSDGDTKTATLTQSGSPNTNLDGTTEYLELPEVILPNDDYYFVTHYAKLESGRNGRNYSMLYDASTWTAYWIAYPMCSDYQGGSGRTDDWGYDPKIPQSAQVNLKSSYGGGGGGDEVNSRGHQVASADRTGSTALNQQTFYYTNMTPQKQGFNGIIWGDLEKKLQGMAGNSNDTLYVVTGAIIRTVGGNETIQYVTKDDKKIPFPNYYYKVVIRRSGSTYKGIGYWFEHFDRDNWRDDLGMKDVKTIREIEALTGYNFFFNLSEADQEAAETSIDKTFWGIQGYR